MILKPARGRRWPKGYWKSWGKVPADFQAPPPLPSAVPAVDLDDPADR